MSGALELHSRLRDAYFSTEVEIGINTVVANTPGSPTYRAMDSFIPGMAIVASIFFGFFNSMLMGFVSLLFGIILMFWTVRKWVLYRVKKRTILYALDAFEPNWWIAWEKGLLSIRVATDEGYVYCKSPDDDWESFVREHVDRR